MSHCERRNEGEGNKDKKKRALPKGEEEVRGCRRLPGSLQTVGGEADPIPAIGTQGASWSPYMEAEYCVGLYGAVAAIVWEGFGILCFLKLQF